nr:MAG TPA: hypothetical protein [Caudoviricetes sp.]
MRQLRGWQPGARPGTAHKRVIQVNRFLLIFLRHLPVRADGAHGAAGA